MNGIVKEIVSKETFDFDKTFYIYKECSRLLIEDEEKGIYLLINILNYRRKFSSKLNEMLADIIESIGFNPYVLKEKLTLSSTSANIRLNSNISNYIEGRYFHDEQKNILDLIKAKINVIISAAPTSFGKSLLIEEIVASCMYSNIVVIQPTLALLDETRKKLTKYNDKYKLIVRTTQEPSVEKKNLFLLTSERVNEYKNFPYIDFLVIDEFYKLSSNREDERSDSLNNAFQYILVKYSPNFYLLGPNIDGISEGFAEKYNAVFYKTKYNMVACEQIDIYKKHKGKFGSKNEKKIYKEKILFELLYQLKGQNTIVYCSSPNRARYLSREYYEFLCDKKFPIKNLDLPIIEWIENYISNEWSLIDCLKYGVCVHDGALQKHITSTLIDYFNKGIVNILFCTSTIIEGVNTVAKNVVFFDNKKGGNKIDFFDYSNIKGRAGRLMEHYIGRIYNFNEIPKKDQIYIDIPFHEQSPVSDEVLININEENIVNKESEQYKYISSLPNEKREMFSKNSLYIKGQDGLVDKLRSEIDENYNLICWDKLPKYEQLDYCLGLAWEFLIKPNESVKPMTRKKLVKVTFDYGVYKNINTLIKNNYEYKRKIKSNLTSKEVFDEAICEAFQILRHWFQYKVPKWLLVVNEIQKFVCNERGIRSGNYVFYATSIETDFIRENLTILSEYGIPKTAINKMSKYINPSINQDFVLKEIFNNRLYEKPGLLEYERIKIIENLNKKY
ncbi:DEAD/DEAH box helicase [Endozoicomonas sp. SM1973]|uniref:DEAD/DEAH box helicase n=1 Tax=Spartinivicinus marinus TaxID=2994442 RepID=A0A853I947_9GAMM|nr:helicase-related protein [Spartinivicinus marinus]MCX4027212.1 helicase-related protein [Spartinivicinus marinus]NYZ66067.1 DEAD/DEAH box helicase [Spartinivicinus marinus]